MTTLTQTKASLAEQFPTPLSPSKFAHFVLRSDRFEEACAWYLKLLAGDVSYGNDEVCFIRYDDEHHRVGIIRVPEGPAVSRTGPGVDHVAFTYPTLGALLATYRRLKREGIVAFWTINHGPTISFYYRDPHGVKVELQYDVFQTEQEFDAYMQAGHHAENFVGVVFDPEDLISRFEAGEDLASLTRRPPLPPGVSPWDQVRD